MKPMHVHGTPCKKLRSLGSHDKIMCKVFNLLNTLKYCLPQHFSSFKNKNEREKRKKLKKRQVFHRQKLLMTIDDDDRDHDVISVIKKILIRN